MKGKWRKCPMFSGIFLGRSGHSSEDFSEFFFSVRFFRNVPGGKGQLCCYIFLRMFRGKWAAHIFGNVPGKMGNSAAYIFKEYSWGKWATLLRHFFQKSGQLSYLHFYERSWKNGKSAAHIFKECSWGKLATQLPSF